VQLALERVKEPIDALGRDSFKELGEVSVPAAFAGIDEGLVGPTGLVEMLTTC
jgi:hypothetical protein